MSNAYGIPEINVQDVAAKLAAEHPFVLLDVREPGEIATANLGSGVETIPMSEIATLRLDALPESMDDKSAEVVVMCHHGGRSLQIAAWLKTQGYTNVHNMVGGIDAWAVSIDPTIGRY